MASAKAGAAAGPPPPPPFVTLPSGVRLSRRELLLLLSSTLRSLGCDAAVAALSAESGGSVGGAAGRVESMLGRVRAGQWRAARAELRSLRLASLGRLPRLRLRLLLLCAAFLEQVEEALEQQRLPMEAVHTLRRSIQPAHRRLDRLQLSAASTTPRTTSVALTAGPFSPSTSSPAPPSPSLFSWSAVCSAALSCGGGASVVDCVSCYLLLSDVAELRRLSGWDGRRGRSRSELADLIAEWMPSDAAVAPKRLLALIDSALRLDLTQCALHTPQPLQAPPHTTASAPLTTADEANRQAEKESPPITSLFHRHHACSMSAALRSAVDHCSCVLSCRCALGSRWMSSVCLLDVLVVV